MIKKMFKKGGAENSVIPQITAETILEKDPLRNASSKIFVMVSPLNESTVGSSPADYEVFHLPRMVAHFVGELMKKQPVVIDNELLTRIKAQPIDTKIVRVDLHNYGDGDNELSLSIYQSSDFDNARFRISVKDPNGKGWKMNDEFQEGLEAIFKTISQKMTFQQ